MMSEEDRKMRSMSTEEGEVEEPETFNETNASIPRKSNGLLQSQPHSPRVSNLNFNYQHDYNINNNNNTNISVYNRYEGSPRYDQGNEYRSLTNNRNLNGFGNMNYGTYQESGRKYNFDDKRRIPKQERFDSHHHDYRFTAPLKESSGTNGGLAFDSRVAYSPGFDSIELKHRNFSGDSKRNEYGNDLYNLKGSTKLKEDYRYTSINNTSNNWQNELPPKGPGLSFSKSEGSQSVVRLFKESNSPKQATSRIDSYKISHANTSKVSTISVEDPEKAEVEKYPTTIDKVALSNSTADTEGKLSSEMSSCADLGSTTWSTTATEVHQSDSLAGRIIPKSISQDDVTEASTLLIPKINRSISCDTILVSNSKEITRRSRISWGQGLKRQVSHDNDSNIDTVKESPDVLILSSTADDYSKSSNSEDYAENNTNHPVRSNIADDKEPSIDSYSNYEIENDNSVLSKCDNTLQHKDASLSPKQVTISHNQAIASNLTVLKILENKQAATVSQSSISSSDFVSESKREEVVTNFLKEQVDNKNQVRQSQTHVSKLYADIQRKLQSKAEQRAQTEVLKQKGKPGRPIMTDEMRARRKAEKKELRAKAAALLGKNNLDSLDAHDTLDLSGSTATVQLSSEIEMEKLHVVRKKGKKTIDENGERRKKRSKQTSGGEEDDEEVDSPSKKSQRKKGAGQIEEGKFMKMKVRQRSLPKLNELLAKPSDLYQAFIAMATMTWCIAPQPTDSIATTIGALQPNLLMQVELPYPAEICTCLDILEMKNNKLYDRLQYLVDEATIVAFHSSAAALSTNEQLEQTVAKNSRKMMLHTNSVPNKSQGNQGMEEDNTIWVDKLEGEFVDANRLSTYRAHAFHSAIAPFVVSAETRTFSKTQENIEEMKSNRLAIAKYIRNKKAEVSEVWESLADDYNNRYLKWMTRVKRLENLNQQDEDSLSNRLRGVPGGLRSLCLGNTLTSSDLPITESDRQVQQQALAELMKKRIRFGTTVPTDMKIPWYLDTKSLSSSQSQSISYKENDLLFDVNSLRLTTDGRRQQCCNLETNMSCLQLNCNCAFVVDRQERFIHPWSDIEKCIFVDKFLQFPKNFTKIASYLKNRSTKDCIKFYYDSKSSIPYKSLLREFDNRKRKLRNSWTFGCNAANSVGSVLYPPQENDDKEHIYELPYDDITYSTVGTHPPYMAHALGLENLYSDSLSANEGSYRRREWTKLQQREPRTFSYIQHNLRLWKKERELQSELEKKFFQNILATNEEKTIAKKRKVEIDVDNNEVINDEEAGHSDSSLSPSTSESDQEEDDDNQPFTFSYHSDNNEETDQHPVKSKRSNKIEPVKDDLLGLGAIGYGQVLDWRYDFRDAQEKTDSVVLNSTRIQKTNVNFDTSSTLHKKSDCENEKTPSHKAEVKSEKSSSNAPNTQIDRQKPSKRGRRITFGPKPSKKITSGADAPSNAPTSEERPNNTQQENKVKLQMPRAKRGRRGGKTPEPDTRRIKDTSHLRFFVSEFDTLSGGYPPEITRTNRIHQMAQHYNSLRNPFTRPQYIDDQGIIRIQEANESEIGEHEQQLSSVDADDSFNNTGTSDFADANGNSNFVRCDSQKQHDNDSEDNSDDENTHGQGESTTDT